ncbi:hypothetical protein [Polaribacter vadi]|uniref:Uncharacterized protein n=1 Tax=Polaribacter vadi TaxID=1774273 RepID=A0A1B8U289_9FLAO|nr:hypothetical protein [Polaribacter vadi]OBY65975.1 hypothetical protein LPB3_02095 [Polaribacter vadi]
MKPLILEFTESPKLQNIDYSLIEYSKEKNLSVLKNTTIPAISYVSMDTETFTKTSGEPSDSDNDYRLKLKRLLDTSTETFTSTEPSDSDNNYSSLKLLMDTQTVTESIEPTDSDK